ncbi:MAG: ATP-binding protein [Alphaproteobacteria bacterium]
MQPALKNDVTEDHKAERIAKEYEDFAYIVSHDLNAPLRHIKEFTRLLVAGRKDNLTVEEQEYVEFLERSLSKLDDMQRALLTFSRLNTRPDPPCDVDCNKVVDDVLKELADIVSVHAPEIEYGKLPVVHVDPKQLHLLFFHLIDNALKFHEDETLKRRIHISATDQEDMWLFEVRDNGIGIAEQYHDEIFRLFRRLNPDQYSGIGAGLTIAQKIVHRFGGEMLIESEPEQGTSVFFSIEKAL